MFRRGPDLVARGTVVSLYRTILNDDGTLERSLKKDTSWRAHAARTFFKAVKGRSPRVGILAVETIADRLEGRPVQKIEGITYPQAVFYETGSPLPPGITAPPIEKKEPALTPMAAPAAPRAA